MRMKIRIALLIFWVSLGVLLGVALAQPEKVVVPNTKYTTGALCTQTDVNFSGKFRYKAHIPYCNRSVTYKEKVKVGSEYGVKRTAWKNYEFDHLFPLSVGGSDSPQNIWPQPIEQAHVKDRIEDAVYLAMRKGTMSQHDALMSLVNWFCQPCKGLHGEDICTPRHIKLIGLDLTSCVSLKVQVLQ